MRRINAGLVGDDVYWAESWHLHYEVGRELGYDSPGAYVQCSCVCVCVCVCVYACVSVRLRDPFELGYVRVFGAN
jgi:aspartate-semialdehyde dehydrogenase